MPVPSEPLQGCLLMWVQHELHGVSSVLSAGKMLKIHIWLSRHCVQPISTILICQLQCAAIGTCGVAALSSAGKVQVRKQEVLMTNLCRGRLLDYF